jgi:hypothetical protein
MHVLKYMQSRLDWVMGILPLTDSYNRLIPVMGTYSFYYRDSHNRSGGSGNLNLTLSRNWRPPNSIKAQNCHQELLGQ